MMIIGITLLWIVVVSMHILKNPRVLEGSAVKELRLTRAMEVGTIQALVQAGYTPKEAYAMLNTTKQSKG